VFSFLTTVIYGSALLLALLSWIAGRKASRLLYGGSAERLNRKIRKQMVWAAYLTVPALVVVASTLTMASYMDSAFWKERVLLHLPLTLIPLLAMWALSMPRLLKLWKMTRAMTGAPLPLDIRRQVAHPLAIVPFQMSALGAGATLYFLFVTSVSLQLTRTLIPILLLAVITWILWIAYDRRSDKAGQPEAVAS
jgi:heme/copper-type cytochrome/quinol oxidase subunit 2